MVDPFKAIRDLLGVARMQLGTDERTAALVDRIGKVEHELTPGHKDWMGDPKAAYMKLADIATALEKLTRIAPATAQNADPLKQSAKPSLPANIEGAIKVIEKARARLAGAWSGD